MNFEEIEKVQIGKKADFTSELKNNSKDYSFHCKNCDNILKMNYENQIDNCWTGHSNKIEKELYGYSAVKVATIPLQSAPGFRCKVHHPFRCKVHHLFRCKGYHLFRSKVHHFSPDLILVKD